MRFGFSGSRSLPASFSALVSSVVSGLPAGAPAGVGDARGADELVRAACPAAVVFSPSFAGRGGFAARSAALVRWVAAGGAGSCFFVFVSSPCPPEVRPSRSFRGCGSGSWGSAALAFGLGLPVRVFWCGPGPAPAFPAWAESFQENLL